MDLTEIEAGHVLLERLLTAPSTGSVRVRPSWIQLFPPRTIEWNRLELPIPNLPAGLQGLRIVHLTDFHFFRRWPAAMDSLLQRIGHDIPDLVLITGDFVDNKRNYRPAMPNVRRLIDGLQARFGIFAIHGNHDHYNIGKELKNSSAVFLDGKRHVVELPGGKVELIGLPGKHRNELTAGVIASYPAREPGLPRIVLSHYPDHLRRSAVLAADLVLAGHTHGGQVCLPGGAPIVKHDSLPRVLIKGAHRVGQTWLVVNRGLGATGLPIRIFCPPEAIEIRLTRAV